MDQANDNEAQPRRHCCSDLRFDFAFNDPVFSDRTLKLMVFDDSLDDEEEGEKEKGGSGVVGGGTESCELMMSLKRMKRDTPKLEEGYEVKKIHVSTVILSVRSSFFRKLFTNGMKECEQTEVALRIYSSEEAALMDILKFMYSSTLSAKSPVALLKVLMTADKFDVPSCVSYCCTLLLSHAMTLEMAFLFIDLSSSIVSNNADVGKLVTIAEDFIFSNLDDIRMYHGHIMNLSLDGIKVLLSNDGFKVDSEDTVYDLFLEWVEVQFPDSEQRSKVFYSELCNILRLDHMTKEKLKHVLTVLLDTVDRSSLTVDSAVRTSILDAIVYNKSNYGFECRPSGRAYKLSSLAATYFEHPVLQCSVFWNLTRKKCQSLGRQDSETFVLGCHVLYLSVMWDRVDGPLTFHLRLKESTKKNVKMDIEFAVRSLANGKQFGKDYQRITWTFVKKKEERYYTHNCSKLSSPRICHCGNSCYYCARPASNFVFNNTTTVFGKKNNTTVFGEPCFSIGSNFINDTRCAGRASNFVFNNTTAIVGEPCFSIGSNFINDIMYLRFDVTLVSEE